MKIAIEAQRIFRPDKHGMDFVALETIRELQKRNDGNEYYIIVASGKDHCLEESANLSIVEVACPTYPLWEQIALPLAVKRLGADLLHCTSNTAPLCCPVPLVLTLHDIIYLEPRQQRSPSLYQEMGRHYRRLTVPRILKKCQKIITVSHFERNRIRESLNIPADRITTIYNGYSRHFRPMDDIDMQIVNRYIPQKDFLFFLGNTDPKKNTARVLKAYSLYLEKSSVRRPLLIADLNETYIDRLLQQENISNRLKQHLFYPAISTTPTSPRCTMQHSLSSTPRCARVSASLWWKLWLAALPSLRETPLPCPKWAVRTYLPQTPVGRKK